MKTIFTIVALFALASVKAQTTPTDDAIERRLMQELHRGPSSRTILAVPSQPANEAKLGSVNCNGILVQLIKTGNPLEMINPAAPLEYGSPGDNLIHEPQSGRGGLNLLTGRDDLKLFSLSF